MEDSWAGKRVSFWGPTGHVLYGTVQSSEVLPDTTRALTILLDHGRETCLPASGVILVNEPISPRQVQDDDITLPKKQS